MDSSAFRNLGSSLVGFGIVIGIAIAAVLAGLGWFIYFIFQHIYWK